MADCFLGGAPRREDILMWCNVLTSSPHELADALLEPVNDSGFDYGLGRGFSTDAQGSYNSKT